MRPIDADELIKRTKRWAINSREAVQQMIIGCPTIDAEPVVRCKDCKYYNKLLPTSSDAKCDLLYGMTDLLGYCSLGERRDKDETD